MGGGTSRPTGDAVAKEQKRQNMLLLGAPCVGKSTIFRQMKLLYRDGFTSAERSRAKVELRFNLITSLLKLDEISLEKGLNLGSNSAEEAVTRLKLILSDFQYDERNDENCVDGHADDGVVVDELVFPKDDVLAVWADPSIQKTHAEVIKHDFQLPVSDTAGRELVLTALPYVLSNIERICDNDFMPSDADCLHLRRHTTSVERISFPCEVTIKNKKEVVACTCTDIGGQAQEQLKWEEHAKNIDVIVFVASMADFDRLMEDGSNALEQQFALLRNVLEADCFGRSNVIVLLNKSVSAGWVG
jgi:guanine nucleotide-binding protein G(i) subunit alpha